MAYERNESSIRRQALLNTANTLYANWIQQQIASGQPVVAQSQDALVATILSIAKSMEGFVLETDSAVKTGTSSLQADAGGSHAGAEGIETKNDGTGRKDSDETPAKVKTTQEKADQNQGAGTTGQTGKQSNGGNVRDFPPTERQKAFLTNLASQKKVTVDMETIKTAAQASEMIEKLKRMAS